MATPWESIEKLFYEALESFRHTHRVEVKTKAKFSNQLGSHRKFLALVRSRLQRCGKMESVEMMEWTWQKQKAL
jgi:hypothetical protein